jgi:hypothetical protein
MMNRTIRLAASIATAALALTALPAFAHDRDGDHDRDWDRHAPAAAYPVPAPPAAYVPAYAPAPAPAPVVVRPVRFENGPRFRELREEYRRLDQARDRFYATWHGNPWRRDRFEAWYGSRRAELDARWSELGGHGRW